MNIVKVLNTTKEIGQSLDVSLAELESLRARVAELESYIEDVKDSKVMSIEQRDHALSKIKESLASEMPVHAALTAGNTYTKRFFDMEPDPIFKRELASFLIDTYGSYSGANPEVWKRYTVL